MGYFYFYLQTMYILYIYTTIYGQRYQQTTYYSYLQFQLSNYIISFKFQLFNQLFYYIILTTIIGILVISYFSHIIAYNYFINYQPSLTNLPLSILSAFNHLFDFIIIIMANQIIYLPALIIDQHQLLHQHISPTYQQYASYIINLLLPT